MISDKLRSFLRAGLVCISAASGWACASAADEGELGRERASIAGGELDSVDSNVLLLASRRGTNGVAYCSASLIAPNLVLTARHCVSDTAEGRVTCGKSPAGVVYPVSTLNVTSSPSVAVSGPTFRVASVDVPLENSDICGYDIALLTLSTVVPASVAKPLVPRIDSAVTVGEVYRAVGYGLDAPGDAGIAGLRRVRSERAVRCIPGTCGTGVADNEFLGGYGICSGDSGGPALDEAGRVVGVVSRSASDCTRPIYGSVAAWKEWITGVAALAAEQGKYSVPFWVTTGSSEAPAEPPVVLGAQGDPCTGADGCQSGLACFSATSSSSDGACVASCGAQATCAAGFSCTPVSGGQVCLRNASSDPSSGACSLAVVGGHSSRDARSGLLVLAACAWGVSKRRRPCGRRLLSYR